MAPGHLAGAGRGGLHPASAEQRCWNHKIVNVLKALPKKEQTEAGERLSALMYAESRSACERKCDKFILRFKKTDPKACATFTRDWEPLVTFFDYPQEHWVHLRTSNIVESPFNAVRLRTDASRRFKKIENAEAMIRKLLLVAEKSWRALKAPHLMRDVYDGKRFKDEIAVRTMLEPTRKAAEMFAHLLTRPPRTRLIRKVYAADPLERSKCNDLPHGRVRAISRGTGKRLPNSRGWIRLIEN